MSNGLAEYLSPKLIREKMKKVLLLLCFMGIGFQAICQDRPKGELTLSFSTGTSEILRTQLEGAGSYDGDGLYGFGLSYLKPLNSWLDVEAGMNYSENKIKFTPAFDPNGSRTYTKTNLSLLSVPVTFRANFMKYFFVNFGTEADFEIDKSSVDNQSGIGAMAGVGFRYGFTPHLSAFINPFLQQHAIFAFRPENHQQRMLDAGVRFGLGVTL